VENENSPFLVSAAEAEEFLSKATNGGDPEPYNEAINQWHFIHRQ
jgi:hypothetical protein